MYGEENIISAVIHVDETTPHLCGLCAVDKAGNLSAKRRDRRQKENAQGSRKFKQCKKGCLALSCTFGTGES